MAGLANANIRLDQSEDQEHGPGHEPMDVHVEDADDLDQPEYSDDGALLRIEHPDGAITISMDGKPIEAAPAKDKDPRWFANLVDQIDDSELGSIAEDLLRGVEDDMSSREEWMQTRAEGIKLLGLTIEAPNVGSTSESPVEGMSKVRHPLLQEAVLRFQANASAEMLPTDGPVKIRDDATTPGLERDTLADALEKDFNHYLTVTASEYYPDTDRMFLLLGFGGTTFKKVYFCPLRNRPVSETVDAEYLIVNNAATDLGNCLRITHRTFLRPSVVRRLQLLGVYADVPLDDPQEVTNDAVQDAKDAQQGVTRSTPNVDDRSREILEIYCELDLKGFEHKYKGKASGLPVPYRVTIDKSSRQVLSIVRNYNKKSEDLPVARENFVQYTFVPGLGFYGIGLLHILGNTTNAVTAAWRELLDAGMYANFPGFLMSDVGGRQATTQFRIPPGGSAQIKTATQPIQQVIMPLPYKDPSPALMGLVDNIAQTGMRVGGTSELQVGEGRADAPVGTTLAMIEQAVKVLNAVHKRMHAAQAKEFQLMAECFREHPESFWQRNPTPATQWDEETFDRALSLQTLVPQADPNTASHGQRMLKIMGIKQLQMANPSLYDAEVVDRAALQALGWSNPDQFLKPAAQRNQPPPEMMQAMAEMQLKKQDSDANAQDKAASAQLKMAQAQKTMMPEAPNGVAGPHPAELELKSQAEQNKLHIAQLAFERDKMNDDSRDQDRAAEVQMEHMRMQIEGMHAEGQRQHEVMMQQNDHAHAALALAAKLASDREKNEAMLKARRTNGKQ